MELVVKTGPTDRKAAETSGPTGTAGARQYRKIIVIQFDYIVIHTVSITIKMVSQCCTETQGVTPQQATCQEKLCLIDRNLHQNQGYSFFLKQFISEY